MPQELLYQIALTQIPQIGDVLAKELLEHLHSASAIFHASQQRLEKIPGIGILRANSIKSFTDFSRPEAEIKFMEQYHIQPVFFTDKNYPARLKNCYDSPVLLYFKGNVDLQQPRVVSIIGTRNNTSYGKEICEQLIADLAPYQILIVSGLAYGIDSIAHKAALKNNLSTIGVLAHGLDRIYPPAHKTLAKEMMENGGLLTDFMSNTNPDKENFPKRNRIVAGLADATIVIETGVKGGSLITANIANSYNRDVFAFPGKISDAKSAGCHYLIRNNLACLITGAKDLAEIMGWENKPAVSAKKQRELFYQLSEEEKIIVNILQQKNQLHIDEIYLQSGLSSSQVAAAILNLELQNLLKTSPGKIYQWVG